MKRFQYMVPLLAIALMALPGVANADTCGKARISAVSPATSTYSGPNQFWNVTPGTTVLVTLSGVVECTGSSIQVIVQSSTTGNFCTTATGSGGTYSFAYPVPANGCGTSVVSYCTSNCSTATGYKALDAGGKCPGHLRAGTSTGQDCAPTVTGCRNPDLGCNPATLPSCSNAQTLGGNTVVGGNTCGATLPLSCSAGTVQTSGCNRSQTFTFSASNACGATASCTSTFTWKIVKEPVFDTLPTGSDRGCNPELPSCGIGTAHDECGSVEVTCTPGTITGPPCSRSQAFTYAATNCAGTTMQDVVYTWKEDKNPPVLSNVPTGGDLGCNPTPPSCDANVSASDDCDGPVNVDCKPGDVVVDGCSRRQTFTYSAIDSCKNPVSQDVTYSWSVVTAPVFDNCYTGRDLGCNPPSIPEFETPTAHDECGPVTVTPGEVQNSNDGCRYSRSLTYTAKGCDPTKTATCTTTYTWVSVTAPVFDDCTPGNDLGCNPENIPTCETAPTVHAHNNCGPVDVSCDGGTDQVDGCLHTRTLTYTAVGCDPSLTTTCQRTYTWQVVTPPVFDHCNDQTIDLGCNPLSIPVCDDSITAGDECGLVLVSCDQGPDTGDDCAGHQRIITYSAKNCAGTSLCVKTYKWTIQTVQIDCGTDICVVCFDDYKLNPDGVCPIPTASDNCGHAIVPTHDADVVVGPDASCSQGFRVRRHWSATGSCGVTAECDQFIIVCCCSGNTCGHTGGGCTFTLGYWKNHGPGDCHSGNNINAWPTTTVNLGFASFDTGDASQAAALCAILSSSGQSLCAQLIAAQLNIAAGADGSAVQSAINDAIACLAANGNSCGDPHSPCKQYTATLDAFNQGLIGPGHCPD